MPIPQLIIYPDEYSLLEAGVPLQQLHLIHPYAVCWKQPHFLISDYTWLVETAWNRISEFSGFAAFDLKLIQNACCDLSETWNAGVSSSFTDFWVNSQGSTLPTHIREIVSRIENALSVANRNWAWLHIGLSAVGRGIKDGALQPTDKRELVKLMAAVGISNKDIFQTPRAMDRAWPAQFQFHEWQKLEAGLNQLSAISSDVKRIQDEPFLPTAAQKAILDLLDSKALKTDALGAGVGDRRSLFSRKGGRAPIYELRVRKLIAWHPSHGYYRPDRPPPKYKPKLSES